MDSFYKCLVIKIPLYFVFFDILNKNALYKNPIHKEILSVHQKEIQTDKGNIQNKQ
jgi:hypothetical protein